MLKDCVQNVLNVLEFKFKDVYATILDCFVNELLTFANRLLPPAAMLLFDDAVCVSLLQSFV